MRLLADRELIPALKGVIKEDLEDTYRLWPQRIALLKGVFKTVLSPLRLLIAYLYAISVRENQQIHDLAMRWAIANRELMSADQWAEYYEVLETFSPALGRFYRAAAQRTLRWMLDVYGYEILISILKDWLWPTRRPLHGLDAQLALIQPQAVLRISRPYGTGKVLKEVLVALPRELAINPIAGLIASVKLHVNTLRSARIGKDGAVHIPDDAPLLFVPIGWPTRKDGKPAPWRCSRGGDEIPAAVTKCSICGEKRPDLELPDYAENARNLVEASPLAGGATSAVYRGIRPAVATVVTAAIWYWNLAALFILGPSIADIDLENLEGTMPKAIEMLFSHPIVVAESAITFWGPVADFSFITNSQLLHSIVLLTVLLIDAHVAVLGVAMGIVGFLIQGGLWAVALLLLLVALQKWAEHVAPSVSAVTALDFDRDSNSIKPERKKP